jgi:hypothetical protein
MSTRVRRLVRVALLVEVLVFNFARPALAEWPCEPYAADIYLGICDLRDYDKPDLCLDHDECWYDEEFSTWLHCYAGEFWHLEEECGH